MKKYFTILLFQILFFKPPHLIAQQDSIRGHVKLQRVFSVTASGDSLPISRKRFDHNGRVTEFAMYSNEGVPVKILKNKYNKLNLLTEEAAYDADFRLHGRTTYQYNEKGKVVEEVHYEKEDEWEYKINTSFDKNGNKTSEIKTGEKGNQLMKALFSYDKNGNMKEEKDYDSKDSITVWYSFRYDSLDHLVEEIRYLRDKEQYRVNYAFNSMNKKESETHTYPFAKSNNSTVWHYDDQQKLASEITYDSGHKIIQKDSFIYENGRLKSEEKNNTLTEYEYDSLGNKMKEKTTSGKILTSEKYFDAMENVIKWMHYSEGALTFSETFSYDSLSMNMLHSAKSDHLNVVLEENEYQYDSTGNMTDEVNKGTNGKLLFRKVLLYEYY